MAPTGSSESYWQSQITPSPRTALTGDIRADVAILGGGFTGLAAAWFLKQAEPSLDVVILERESVGFGASGRNAGFVMTLFGLTLGTTALRFGQDRAREAHRYSEQAVDLVRELITEHGLDSGFEFPGFLRVATSPRYEERLKRELDLAHRLGITDVDWLTADRLAEEVRSPLFRGAWWEPRSGLLDPARHARALAGLVEGVGVRIFEGTAATRISRDSEAVVLDTPGGSVRAGKVALATNAWSHFIPGLKRKQVPVFTHIVLTEPLTPRQREEIGWARRQGLEDARNLVHYFRLTPDDRLLMGGRDVTLPYGGRMDYDDNRAVFRALEADVAAFFPALRDVRITHRWGGPVSMTLDFAPALGHLGDERVVYALGCIGHGVALSHLNGWTLADLLLERRTERTERFFVNRTVVPVPPEPLRLPLLKGIKRFLDAEDRRFDPS